MWTLGIDIAKRRHVATLLDDAGKRAFKNFSFTNTNEGFQLLNNRIQTIGISADNILIGMEATGHYWMILYHCLCDAGYQVRVINPLMTAARRNVGIRGTKSDSVDSEIIANILREADPKFSAIPDDQTRQMRNLTRLRYECSQTLTAEKQRLNALLDLVFPEYKQHFSDIFGAASRKVLSQFPTSKELAKVDIRTLTRIIKEASRGQKGREDAKKLKAAAVNSFALNGSVDAFTLEIQFIIQRVNLLSTQIEELTKQIKQYYKQEQKLLLSIPGIGPVWASTILSESLPFFHPDKKDGGSKLVAAAGLDVKKYES
jgi:transposase